VVTPLAAVLIWATVPSDSVIVPAMLNAKPVTGPTKGVTRAKTVLTSGAMSDLASGGEKLAQFRG
jgi:hypothetical protein